MYQCFCWSLWVMINFYDFYEGAVIWLTFTLQTMVLWRDKYLVYHNVAFTILSHLCCWFNIQGIIISGMELMRYLVFDSTGLILLTSVFVDELTLIWYIMVVKRISKIPVENGFNHRIGCWNVNIFYLYIFKDLFNCGFEYSGDLVSLWYTFKLYII